MLNKMPVFLLKKSEKIKGRFYISNAPINSLTDLNP